MELQYVFTGKGKKETLRGRPVAFALWSESKMEWTVAHIEIPRPPVKWKPGRKPLPAIVVTPGIEAKHVKGTGAERLMFSFTSADGEPLKVYGRKGEPCRRCRTPIESVRISNRTAYYCPQCQS